MDPQFPYIRGLIRAHKQKKNCHNSSQLDHRTSLHNIIAHNQFIRKTNRKPKPKKNFKWHISIQTACTPVPQRLTR